MVSQPKIAEAPYRHPADAFGLEGRVAIITGAATGIGRATVQLLVAYGAYAVVAGRRLDLLSTLVDELPAGRAMAVSTDVRSDTEVRKLVDAALDRFGRLDVAVNNAGIFGRFGPLHEDDDANFNAVVDTNLRGIWLCMKYQIAAMLKGESGAIVNCASVAGHQGHAQSPIYSATKHAIIGLSKSAALQYARFGVRVNAVSPGSTDTEMLRTLYPSAVELEQRAQRAPLGRLGQPSEVAAAIVFLCSRLSSYATGHVFVADGGVTAGQVSGLATARS